MSESNQLEGAANNTAMAPPDDAETAVRNKVERKRKAAQKAAPPQPDAPAARGPKRPRNPSLCYLLVEARADGKPGKVYGSHLTRGRAIRALEVLADAGVCDPRAVSVFRAVKVAPE